MTTEEATSIDAATSAAITPERTAELLAMCQKVEGMKVSVASRLAAEMRHMLLLLGSSPCLSDDEIRRRLAKFSLTPRQLEIAVYLVRQRIATGLTPTLRELGREFGVSKVTILETLRNMADKRVIRIIPHVPRGIKFTDALLNG